MNATESAAFARKVIDAYNAHNLDELESCYAASSETLTVPTGERALGPDGARHDTQRWLTAFPDMQFEIANLAAGDDFVAVEVRFRGTNTGPLALPEGELAATGRPVEIQGCMVLQFKDGKILTEHDYFDRATMSEQLGIGGERPAAATEEQRPVP